MVLLFVIILMNAGTVVVSLTKIGFQAIEGIFVSLLLATVLTFILNPVIVFLENLNLSRTIAITTVYLSIGVSFGVIFGNIVPSIQKEFRSLQKEIPLYKEKIVSSINEKEALLKQKYPVFKKVHLSTSLESYLKNRLLKSNKSDIIVSSSKIIGSFLTLLIMVPFITFFFLKDGFIIKKTLIGAVPNRYFEMSLNLIYEINRQLGGFIRARLLEAVCVGIICFVGLTFFNVKYAAVLALFAALMNLIPYIGPVIGALPAIFIAFVDTGSWVILTQVVIVFIAAQLFDIFVIIPAVFARIVDMHPLMVVIVIIVGGQLGGIIGMILAVPIYSVTKVTIREIFIGLSSLRI